MSNLSAISWWEQVTFLMKRRWWWFPRCARPTQCVKPVALLLSAEYLAEKQQILILLSVFPWPGFERHPFASNYQINICFKTMQDQYIVGTILRMTFARFSLTTYIWAHKTRLFPPFYWSISTMPGESAVMYVWDIDFASFYVFFWIGFESCSESVMYPLVCSNYSPVLFPPGSE